MSAYEMMYIAKPDLDDDALQALADKLTGVITAGGGAVDGIEKLGKKRFAYEINDFREGHYALIVFNGPAELPAELDRVVRLTDEIIRHLIVKHVPPEMTTPRAPAQRPAPKPLERPRPVSAPAPAQAEAAAPAAPAEKAAPAEATAEQAATAEAPAEVQAESEAKADAPAPADTPEAAEADAKSE